MRWRALLVLALLLGGAGAQAQSGPYGNEWIVPSQPYYKVKIWRDGLYRLDYAYLAKLGAGAVAHAQLQVWRRGRPNQLAYREPGLRPGQPHGRPGRLAQRPLSSS